MAAELREKVAHIVKGLDRYNPENLPILEKYVVLTASENLYDLEAYLAVLKTYQFRPSLFNENIAVLVFLKALTNLPHSDFTLCKCILDLGKLAQLIEEPFAKILALSELLETCQFDLFWNSLDAISDRLLNIKGFEDSIRKFVCHVIGITFQVIKKSELKILLGGLTESQVNQWIATNKWKDKGDGYVFIANQEVNIKTKNISEKITFEGVAAVMQLATNQ
ncbi:hypothetical protein HELRODRAFT_159094 [Helobdella robusta]|uniref:Eukaryotic translation initiation factor 3 subunit K n=1 Tax=Helobdella robusta TaxID=6412 RepID=T1ENK9_HELRO|nr:hypothetical protein HELRODRAFT_159094 [Helobdella robusta]ESO12538.1 hypothetical protein HELRODRAFT_159094 [Helobdella robusta]